MERIEKFCGTPPKTVQLCTLPSSFGDWNAYHGTGKATEAKSADMREIESARLETDRTAKSREAESAKAPVMLVRNDAKNARRNAERKTAYRRMDQRRDSSIRTGFFDAMAASYLFFGLFQSPHPAIMPACPNRTRKFRPSFRTSQKRRACTK